jgi:hypothetical protein
MSLNTQLVCACSEDAARVAVWAGSFARVNAFKCLSHVGHGEGELWHCIILKAGEGV